MAIWRSQFHSCHVKSTANSNDTGLVPSDFILSVYELKLTIAERFVLPLGDPLELPRQSWYRLTSYMRHNCNLVRAFVGCTHYALKNQSPFPGRPHWTSSALTLNLNENLYELESFDDVPNWQCKASTHHDCLKLKGGLRITNFSFSYAAKQLSNVKSKSVVLMFANVLEALA